MSVAMLLFSYLALAGLASVLTGAAPTPDLLQEHGGGGMKTTAAVYAQRSYFYAGGQYVNASLVSMPL